MFLLQKSTIQLLRFHFSLFLLPVYLFALSELPVIPVYRAAGVFCILHFLVYPSSNGYNSYMDRDQTPIGGLHAPLQPTIQLFRVSVIMDIMALLASLIISHTFALGILLYITASRIYSYRGIRLKQYPVTGFLTVFIFQGALIFYITYQAVHPVQASGVSLLSCTISSFLIGALYPLTQVFQHDEDRKDGVTTISMLLGKIGTFIFSLLLFSTATCLLYFRFKEETHLNYFFIFLLMMLPVVLFFVYWMLKVWRDEKNASYANSLRMNSLATVCTALFFITLIILNH